MPLLRRKCSARCSVWRAMAIDQGRFARNIHRRRCSPRISFPGGLTPAALVNVRLCIEKIVIFRQTVVVTAPGAGGVSPPWSAPRMETLNRRFRALQLQARFANPRRANARRSCFARRYSPNMVRSALQARSIATHGGLTPAALADVRLCIEKIVIFRQTVVVTAPGAGGVSPPWSALRMRTRNRKFSALQLQTRLAREQIHGGLTPAAIARTCFAQHCRRVPLRTTAG
jgi:hypothetical protein